MKIKSNIDEDNLDDIEFELGNDELDRLAPVRKKNPHYINGNELYEEFVKYYEKKCKAIEKGEPIPPLSEKIGKAIIQIATRRCNHRWYVRYSVSWKEEMIGNAIMLATIHGHNFDPNKSKNAFAYLTTICDNAIKEQLKKERKDLYVRYKQFDNLNGYQASDQHGDLDDSDDGMVQDMSDSSYFDRIKYITDFEERTFNSKKNDKKPKANSDIIELDI